MRSSTNTTRRSLDRSFLGSSPFITPFALPVQPVLDALSLTPASVVVELGPVAGRFTLPIARYFATKKGTGTVHACEFKKDGVDRILQKAKDAHVERFVTPHLLNAVSSRTIPVDDGEVDTIISISTFAFQSQPTPFMEECFRALCPGGQLFIAEWRDARKALSKEAREVEVPKEAAWRILKKSGNAICTAIDIPGLEWAVLMVKPVVQVSF